ncbi:hypothetical protein D1631_18570 [Chryseobacterium nematophagum]|uniref:Lipid A biosynthesis N-terminal domain-containing protein n=1 Tax=Chryseobacterium nematophagum TaxID=2305228 RepID=A0A3M7TB63_9FLAO|nr:SemiSWEET transporter [Chryseobacterium nematophagum]RNA60495.1 hypothetical protein D1631_18570 [Chryseobacterium nematophagum]
MNTDILGIIAGILTSTAMIPQLVKVFRTKKVEDLSLGMLIFGVTGLSIWLIYGFLKKDFPIILSNTIALMVNLGLLVSHIRYKKK